MMPKFPNNNRLYALPSVVRGVLATHIIGQHYAATPHVELEQALTFLTTCLDHKEFIGPLLELAEALTNHTDFGRKAYLSGKGSIFERCYHLEWPMRVPEGQVSPHPETETNVVEGNAFVRKKLVMRHIRLAERRITIRKARAIKAAKDAQGGDSAPSPE